MGILTGKEIVRQRNLGKIIIEPFEPKHIGENSYDLRLGDILKVYDLKVTGQTPAEDMCAYDVGGRLEVSRVLDMKKDNPYIEVPIPPEGLVLRPNCLYIGHTLEYTETHGFAPMVDGRSSVGRLGMCVHVTAGFGDNHFKGDWTLEITVIHPLRVYAGARVAQIWYETLEGAQGSGYVGKYQGQRGPKASAMWKDFLPKPEQVMETLCQHCDHFVEENYVSTGDTVRKTTPTAVTLKHPDGSESTQARYIHLDDGEQEYDHDAEPGETHTSKEWAQRRPELTHTYADGNIGPNSKLHSRRGKDDEITK